MYFLHLRYKHLYLSFEFISWNSIHINDENFNQSITNYQSKLIIKLIAQKNAVSTIMSLLKLLKLPVAHNN